MQRLNVIGKVCLLGDGQVGKTSLIRKFVLDQFSDSYITTVGTKVSKKKVSITFPAKEKVYDLTIMEGSVIVHEPQLSTAYERASHVRCLRGILLIAIMNTEP